MAEKSGEKNDPIKFCALLLSGGWAFTQIAYEVSGKASDGNTGDGGSASSRYVRCFSFLKYRIQCGYYPLVEKLLLRGVKFLFESGYC